MNGEEDRGEVLEELAEKSFGKEENLNQAEAKDPQELEEKKTTLEELEIPKDPKDEGVIAGLIRKLQDKLDGIRAKKKEAEWLQTEEGKLHTAQMRALYETERQNRLRIEKYLEEQRREAMRQLALSVEAEHLIKKHKISQNDPRLNHILRRMEEIEFIIGDAYTKK